MNEVDELVRDVLTEQADAQSPASTLLADRVLTAHRRRAQRRIVGVAAVTAAVVGLAFWGPLPGGAGHTPAGKEQGAAKEIVAHPDQSPPRDLIAAGDVMMAGYVVPERVLFEEKGEKSSEEFSEGEIRRTFWLLDPDSRTYEKDERWSTLAIAPSGLQAAVLERGLPSRRIGILDLRTREVERWIDIGGDDRQGIGGLAFSQDGASLLATTYHDNPDRLLEDASGTVRQFVESTRTGFWHLDLATGERHWAAVEAPVEKEHGFEWSLINTRQDFEYTQDGRAVRSGLTSRPGRVFHDLRGRSIDPPPGEVDWEPSVEAGVSPDGRLMAGPFAGKRLGTSSWILDTRTGRKTEVPGQQLLAWAGNDSLIAWDIGKGSSSEHANRLVLVTIGSDRTVPLSGPRGSKGDKGRWQPLFVRR
ncbi:WD40 repeat domain-containing protein [Streptomyces sp. NPDC002734]|uniref:WD40 repeat domain-containing protein n=1 Tax=Streptomyces sp. NPDC002734 TaxID=3154426 RepID=UPI00332C2CEB